MESTEFESIKTYLPRDWATRVADKVKVTPEYVRKVAKGDANNDQINIEVLVLASAEKKRLDRLKTKRNKIFKQIKPKQ